VQAKDEQIYLIPEVESELKGDSAMIVKVIGDDLVKFIDSLIPTKSKMRC
jgi:hypothetical protein